MGLNYGFIKRIPRKTGKTTPRIEGPFVAPKRLTVTRDRRYTTARFTNASPPPATHIDTHRIHTPCHTPMHIATRRVLGLSLTACYAAARMLHGGEKPLKGGNAIQALDRALG